MNHIVRIAHWRWYLPEKNQERVQTQNLLQELIQKKCMWSTHSQSDSLHTWTEWIICSASFSIISGKGGWRFSLSCSWFEWVFNRGWYEKPYRKLALRSHPEKNKHSQASAVMRMINEDKEGLEDTLRYRLVPAQEVHFFYTRSHLSALQNCAILLSTNFQFIFLLKKCITQFND